MTRKTKDFNPAIEVKTQNGEISVIISRAERYGLALTAQVSAWNGSRVFRDEFNLHRADLRDKFLAGVVKRHSVSPGERKALENVLDEIIDLVESAFENEPDPEFIPIEPDWPEPLGAEAFHGLAGAVVWAIAPTTEADEAALLINFLVAFGNAVGRGPYAIAEADRHGINLFAVLVGDSAKGRKGSSWGRIRDLFERVDATWACDNVASGLASGEGIIHAVRDKIEKPVAVKEKGNPTGEYTVEIVDHGVDDKRLLVIESEFASLLKVMGREGNTLSPVIRQAWDSGNLRSLTKNSPSKATGAHISVLAHVTKDELLRYLNDTEVGNGFANRFLWACVRRARILPEGGEPVDLNILVARLHTAIQAARVGGQLKRDEDTRDLWALMYPDLSEGKPGMFGTVTARAEAQVLRLSVLYAVLDGDTAIRKEHLMAAWAVWTYCENSVRRIFGEATGDYVADKIQAYLKAAQEGMSRTDLSSMFGNNLPSARIDQALGTLLAAGRVRRESRETGGRPKEVWVLV